MFNLNYLIVAGIALVSSIVLFFTLKQHKITRIVLIIAIWLILGAVIGLRVYLEKPIIFLNGNSNVVLEVYDVYNESGASAQYRLKDITDEIVVEGSVDTQKIGTYKVTYTVTADGKTVVAERTIDVKDTTPPELTLQGESRIIASSIKLYKEPGFSAKDNYDKELTDKVNVSTEIVAENLYKKVYSITDSSGNNTTLEREVEIKDIVAPVITLNGSEIEYTMIGETYTDPGASASDDLDGDVSNSIIKEGNVDIGVVGTYKITYYAKDHNGNIGTAERTVQVIEKKANGIVYLTFDDGPSLSITPQILDILQQENVRATFFILNYNDDEEYLVKRIVNEGHAIGIHGYSHEYGEIYQSEEAYMNNLSKLREKIKASTGVDTTITRFPGGSSNTVSKYNPGIMSRLVKLVVESGYHYFDWNVSSADAGGAQTSEDVYDNVVWSLKEDRSNVVLMHDFSGNTKTLNALRDIIHFCKDNGYIMDKITMDTPMVTHGVAN